MFKVQINWGHPNLENDWSTVGETPTLERALKKLEYDSGLARIVAPLRVINETNYVYARYNPELDWRLPGCLWRRTQERAYQLWEKSNKNESSDYYWMLANQQLLEEKNEGILEGDFTQEELNMYEWRTKRIKE